ncbi:hypothetical protein E2C01_087985 [Portunus trituberculatus]|uniref:MADF domain-containing protein n=1 Tax=Portunus trituberculatus TaxID=210409 RepID=A0A5B7JES6_PORTR|nr:hypothetical protein [Portunus trituberculatus]
MDNAGQWSKEVLQLTMVNTVDQWVEESTRYRGEEEPSLLDLVFTEKPEPPPIIQYFKECVIMAPRFSDEEDEILVDEVAKQPSLWHLSHPKYKDQRLKDVWAEVANKV